MHISLIVSYVKFLLEHKQEGVNLHILPIKRIHPCLKYLAELSVVILKLFQIITMIHYQTSTKSIKKLKCNENGTFMVEYSCLVMAYKMHNR